MSFNPNNYKPNKYSDQAATYSTMVSSVDGSLSNAIGELNRSSQMLNFDAKKKSDLLSYNVAANTQEIKSEIEEVQSNLSTYVGLISAKATQLDQEEKALYDAYMAMLRAKLAKEKEEEQKNNS